MTEPFKCAICKGKNYGSLQSIHDPHICCACYEENKKWENVVTAVDPTYTSSATNV